MITTLVLLVVATIVPAVLLALFGNRIFKTETAAQAPAAHARRLPVHTGGQVNAYNPTTSTPVSTTSADRKKTLA
jgi:hypothetical protein